MDDDFEKGTGPRKFSYSDLVCSTNNFLEQEKLGQGGFGAVYRGFLKELDSYVPVKRISGGSKQGLREYASEWVWDLYGGGKLLEAADPRVNWNFDERRLERLVVVGLWCAHPDAKFRPSIRQVIQVLNFESPLPVLPSKLPMPTYFSPTVNASLPLPLSLGASISGEAQS
ncbi:hypothetical protein GH714_040582 [Hevea brasiliensis]|uniref:Protein kinase domain-containing protein n=1 Tax=Hevea brasiliensis TaxID=3981 RepID=A0A6A6L940_HEVBR|nr:hypothetical protein GH714_040582 [Hevea brasiliensis]